MKKLWMSALLIGAVLPLGARTLTVQSIERVNLASDMPVTEAVISPDGAFAVVSDAASAGLSRVDLNNGAAKKITDNGSLLNLQITSDGENVIYRQRSTNKKKLTQTALQSTNLQTGKTTEIVKATRDFNGFTLNNQDVVSVATGVPGKTKTKVRSLGDATATKATSVGIHRGHLVLTVNGQSTILDPQGRGSYLWPSLSPDGTKVLYYKAQKGCFVCDLDGSNVKELGYLQAAKWLDNEMVIGMEPYDDGTNITASSVIASDLAGKKQKLTGEDVIAMYPTATVDGSKIAFTDTTGNLYIINIATK